MSPREAARLNARPNGSVVKELNAIKRLLVLQLLTSGVRQGDIARAMGVDPSILRRIMPLRQFKEGR